MALLLVLSLIHKTGFELFGIDVEHVQPKRCSLRCTIWFDFMLFCVYAMRSCYSECFCIGNDYSLWLVGMALG